MIESNSLQGKPVHIRSFDCRIAGAAQDIGPHLVGIDDEDIGPRLVLVSIHVAERPGQL
jgi:hypothetical protein